MVAPKLPHSAVNMIAKR
jgi:predicted RNA-binding Zn-ribbon protein involved in translation (DUF1610 family)